MFLVSEKKYVNNEESTDVKSHCECPEHKWPTIGTNCLGLCPPGYEILKGSFATGGYMFCTPINETSLSS